MSPEEWEQYIKTLEVGKCKSDFMKLVNELTTRFWFDKQKKVFDTLSIQDLDKKIEDKFEQDCEAKELRYVTFATIWTRDSKGGFTLYNGVVRDTLKALIAEMKTERQKKLAEANKRYEAPSDPGVGILVYI